MFESRYKKSFYYEGAYEINDHLFVKHTELIIIKVASEYEVLWSSKSYNRLNKALMKADICNYKSVIFRVCDSVDKIEKVRRIFSSFKLRNITFLYKKSIPMNLNESIEFKSLVKRNELEDVFTLVNGIFPKLYVDEKNILNLYKDKSRKVIVHRDALERIDGCLICVINNNSCFVESIAVKKEMRRRGIGKRLLLEMVTLCNVERIYEAFLLVDSKKSSLIGFYEDNGFVMEDDNCEICFSV